MMVEISDPQGREEADVELENLAADHEKTPRARAVRLKDAVNLAGGPASVARQAGMPLATLNNYLAGRDMKASALVSLAEVCDVSVRWLASGDGAMREGTSADIGSIIPRFGESISKPANFWALIVLLRSCQEFHQQVHLVPSLAEVFEWIGPLYAKARELPDRKIDLKPEGTDPS